MTQAEKSLACIKRTEPGEAEGSSGVWIVTIVRAGSRFSARFRDKSFSDSSVALQAAQAYRDAVHALLPNRRKSLLSTAPAGKTAFVRRAVFSGKANWMIRMHIGGKLRTKLFSVRKYGEEDARRRALALRPQWLIEAGLGESEQHLPSEIEVIQLERNIRVAFGEKISMNTKRSYNQAPMYGITRSDADALGQDGAWTVMIMRRKVRHGGRFADRKYGGMELALKEAQACRDNIIATVVPFTRRERSEILLKTNKSGVTGVRLEKDKHGKPYAWAAEIRIQKKTETKRFSIARYGEQRALELAVDARKAMVRKIEGYVVFTPVLKANGS
jgi:hypothetical protein